MKFLFMLKRQPILYNILSDIETLATSDKCYTIELTHDKAKILRRYITKLQNQVEREV